MIISQSYLINIMIHFTYVFSVYHKILMVLREIWDGTFWFQVVLILPVSGYTNNQDLVEACILYFSDNGRMLEVAFLAGAHIYTYLPWYVWSLTNYICWTRHCTRSDMCPIYIYVAYFSLTCL
jgi:hypothetical protein